MKPPPFDYHAPATLEEACALLATLENAKVLAGGQSLVPMLNLRFLYPDHVIDVNGIPQLGEIVVHRDRVTIGAMVRQRKLETDPEIARNAPIFTEALPLIGHRQTRNRGTIGGSLCHLDPSAELPLLALVHDATIHTVASGGRERAIPIDQFIGGFMSPAIEPDELVVTIDVPYWPAGHGYAFIEHARRHGDFALAAVTALMTLDGNGRVTRVALGVGGIGPVAVRLTPAETLLTGSVAEPAVVERAARCCDELEALTDVHGHAAYRRSVAAALVRRAIASAYARAQRRAA
jgi:aerobic carbon-monoxide dehydrogenase medium subunit